MKKHKIMRITVVGTMAALSSIVYLFLPEIPIVPSLSFLRIDFSDIPAILTGHLVGTWPGVLVLILKNIIHVFKPDTFTFGIGELVNVLVGSAVVIGSTQFGRLFQNRLGSDIGRYYVSSALTVVLTMLVGIVSNLTLMPLYFQIAGIPQQTFGALITTVLVANTPLNAFKSAALTLPWYPVITMLRKSLPRSLYKEHPDADR